MNISFEKYHGAGNDFIMVDCRGKDESFYTTGVVKFLCNRHLGVGSDGLILLLNDDSADFRMKYYNADGREGTMCGNGGRCISAFAYAKGIIGRKTTFVGIDGLHEAVIKEHDTVSLKMIDVTGIRKLSDGFLMDTGSTHFVAISDDISVIDVCNDGRRMRYQPRFGTDGTNVNFIQLGKEGEISIRTYERGVEDETLACGTGSVASAIAAFLESGTDRTSFTIHALGGNLKVSFTPDSHGNFHNVWLEGPVKHVFNGDIRM